MNLVSDQIDLVARLLAGLAVVAIVALGAFATDAGAASSGGIGIGEPTAPSDGRDSANASERVGGKYERIWDRFSTADRRWAHRTAECESGGNPDAIGGGGIYRGAFQFMRSTWKASPRSPGGDPIRYSFRTQAVVAVLLKKRDGAQHWPVCG
jgi:Transglycosylase-like domain